MTEGTVDQPQLGLRRIIERPRLTRLLDESPARIKMLVAPAGYGKTTLARQWLKRQERYGWFGLTAAAADPAELITQLAMIAALIEPSCDARVRERLSYTTEPENEWSVLLDMLTEDLAQADPTAWICIDDHHLLIGSRTGEEIVAAFVERVPFGVLLVSRERPAWVTTRMILYGEIAEVGRSALAMTYDEASAAFASDRNLMPGLVHLADGWPAVLAIAALNQQASEIPDDISFLPDQLYLFFAEELYSSLEPTTAEGLAAIALAGADHIDILREVVDGIDDIVRRGLTAGWLSSVGTTQVEFHPLLQTFLCEKLDREHHETFRLTCRDVGNALIQHGHWDHAFRLITTFALAEMIVPLIESAWKEILHVGRVSTLREWMDYASNCGVKTPQITLARAEVLFRSGRFYESELAAAEVGRLPESHGAHAEALIAAGRAAHAASREEQALGYFEEARGMAVTLAERSAAMLGELSAAIDLELPEATDLLETLRHESHSQSREHQIVLTGRAIAMAARFGLPQDLGEARNAYQLLPALPDPIARTSFRNVFAYTLAMAGLTDEAASVLTDQRTDARVYRVDFSHAYADVVDALIALFEGRFDDVAHTLEQIEVTARRRGDSFLLANAVSIRARMLLSIGELDASIAAAARFVGPSTVSMRGEIEASYAVALACAGRRRDARDAATAAATSTRSSEIVVLVECVDAILKIQASAADSFAVAERAFRAAMHLDVIGQFVTALRGFPELGAILLGAPGTRRELVPVLVACNELKRFDGATDAAATSGSWGDLSRREREVLQLVALGLTNRAIGARLFIAESTAKVHVRNILGKLGVPSRTVAALRVPPFARLTQPEREGGPQVSDC